jgi:hypothetical protein
VGHRFIEKQKKFFHGGPFNIKFFLLAAFLAIQISVVVLGRPVWPFHHLDMFAKPLEVPNLKLVFVTFDKQEVLLDEAGTSPYSWWEFRHLVLKKYFEGPEAIGRFLNVFLEYKKLKFPEKNFKLVRVYKDCPDDCRLMASAGVTP